MILLRQYIKSEEGFKVIDQNNDYIEKLETVKEILEIMVDLESGFYCLEDCDEEDLPKMYWETELAEIEINDIENDVYYITVCVSPAVEKKGGHAICCIHYFYRIEGNCIEREFAMTFDVPSMTDYGEKVLNELVFILNSGNLILTRKKNINAP